MQVCYALLLLSNVFDIRVLCLFYISIKCNGTVKLMEIQISHEK